jgi:DNA-binding CsgD family transcriptional regulator
MHLRGQGRKNLGLRFILGVASLVVCIGFFGFDALSDLLEHLIDDLPFSRGQLIHLVLEVVGVIGLVFAAGQLKNYFDLLQLRAREVEQSLSMMRGEFQRVMQDRFNRWQLTKAEADVALMIVKGLGAAEIAQTRATAIGTVKAQTTAIFRKIGVNSKAELMAAIVDEFIDSDTLVVAPSP